MTPGGYNYGARGGHQARRDVPPATAILARPGSDSSLEPFYQRVTELRTPGILMSGDPDEGPVLGGRKATPLPPGRGYLVRRDRRISLIQTVLAEASAAEPRPLPRAPDTRRAGGTG